MKPYLAAIVDSTVSATEGRNQAREYLQARILQVLQRVGAMVPLAFHGGTALRFLYGISRYSEDLDFALERAPEEYRFTSWLGAIERQFEAEGYAVQVRWSDRQVVHSAFVRFPGLLHELRLSPHRTEVLAVKIEVDTNPPAGAGLETTVIRRHTILHLQHHDRATLLAGKLHAFLQREFVKGRDVFDLLWYLSDPTWPDPNLVLLNNALGQTGWKEGVLTPTNWAGIVSERVGGLSWERVIADVTPFLEDASQAALLTRGNLLRLLNAGSPGGAGA
jgi:hypothetical protein